MVGMAQLYREWAQQARREGRATDAPSSMYRECTEPRGAARQSAAPSTQTRELDPLDAAFERRWMKAGAVMETFRRAEEQRGISVEGVFREWAPAREGPAAAFAEPAGDVDGELDPASGHCELITSW